MRKGNVIDSDLDLIEQLLKEGKHFTRRNFAAPNSGNAGQFCGSDTPEWLAWKTRTINSVHRIFASNSPTVALARSGISIVTAGNFFEKFDLAHSTLLKSLEMAASVLRNDAFGELKKPESKNQSPVISNRVFVVHGHDSALKTDVERFLHEIGLEPVVLHRQVDEGATIIEKFEKHSDVGYAFILLTPDEIAYPSAQVQFDDLKRKKEFRSRPNVIFEFGYFVGRLGRARVCCLVKGQVEVPSDLQGLVYKRIDHSIESEGIAIIRELKAAGYAIKL